MPNHCYNRVTISAHEGKEDQFKEVLKAFESDSPFETLYPSPDWPNTPNDKGELPELREMKNSKGEVFTTTYEFPDGTNDDRCITGVCITGARNGRPTIDRRATLTKNVAMLSLVLTRHGRQQTAFIKPL